MDLLCHLENESSISAMELEFWPCAGERNARVHANDSGSLKNSIWTSIHCWFEAFSLTPKNWGMVFPNAEKRQGTSSLHFNLCSWKCEKIVGTDSFYFVQNMMSKKKYFNFANYIFYIIFIIHIHRKINEICTYESSYFNMIYLFLLIIIAIIFWLSKISGPQILLFSHFSIYDLQNFHAQKLYSLSWSSISSIIHNNTWQIMKKHFKNKITFLGYWHRKSTDWRFSR